MKESIVAQSVGQMGKRAFPAFASTSLFDFCDLSDAQELAGIKMLDLCIRVSCSDLHPWHGSNRPPNGMVTSPASLQPPNCRTSSLSEEPLDIRVLGKRKHAMIKLCLASRHHQPLLSEKMWRPSLSSSFSCPRWLSACPSSAS